MRKYKGRPRGRKRIRLRLAFGTAILYAFVSAYVAVWTMFGFSSEEPTVAVVPDIESTGPSVLASILETVRDKFNSTNAHPCRSEQDYSYIDSQKCLKGPIVYFNPLYFERILCGSKIEPLGTLEMRDPCLEESSLFGKEPTVTNMPPIKADLQSSWIESNYTEVPCDVGCLFQETYFQPFFQYNIEGTSMETIYSLEGPGYYPILRIDPNAHRHHLFYMTTSFQSEIPVAYYRVGGRRQLARSKPMDPDAVLPAALFLARNCAPLNDREEIVAAMRQAGFRVDAPSTCMNNMDLPDEDLQNKTALMRRYMFFLAFENHNEDDYITEKLWDSLEAGVIPVYYGAPNVKERVPEHSVVRVQDFDGSYELVVHLRQIAQNRSLYDSYHAWRYTNGMSRVDQIYNFTRTHDRCRMCRMTYAMRYGLVWNRDEQALQPIHRKLVSLDGQLSGLVREDWPHSVQLSPAGGREVSIQQRGRRVGSRSLLEHDGFLDVRLELPRDLEYCLTVGLMGRIVWNTFTIDPDEVRSNDNEWSDDYYVDIFSPQNFSALTSVPYPSEWNVLVAQNATRRVSFTAWPTIAEWKSRGDRVCLPSRTRRLRIVVEAVDAFHTNVTLNYFGRMVALDFYQPIEAFVVLE